ncbi:hypothetical protein EVAR_69659_1 [Eumeta japonica]|uniref:Uncharacterized protein n=1 Tax=Eumeta variegata TaxID=151549 RepID=A0A4C2A435_EUMVA|nr:hypothetical protein EVAR_69659_1 [Eumeta japonica]
MFSSLFDHCMQRPAQRGCVGCFNAPCTLVDVTVGNFLRMCLVGMKRQTASGMFWSRWLRDMCPSYTLATRGVIPADNLAHLASGHRIATHLNKEWNTTKTHEKDSHHTNRAGRPP